MSKPIIETKDLTKIYGDIRAVDHLNLTVDEERSSASWGRTAPEKRLR